MTDWLDTYPHKIYASVVLYDKKIMNWKIANYRWTNENWLRSKQPFLATKDGSVDIVSAEFTANDIEEHNIYLNMTLNNFLNSS